MMTEQRGTTAKERVARAFLRGLQSYDQEAAAQRTVNERLMVLLDRCGRRGGRILEVGCCTGMLTEALCRLLQPRELFLNDLVADFFDPVAARLDPLCRPALVPCFGDIETCELPRGIDLVASSSTLQWLGDLGGFFGRMAASLAADGRLVFSMFGRETLVEVTELTGVGLSYPTFAQVRDLLDQRFRIEHAEVYRDRLCFAEPLAVLRHIQATGVGGVGGFTWTPRRLEHFCREYARRFGDDRGVRLSYVSYLFAAEKRP